MAMRAEIVLEIDFERTVFTLDFSGQLDIIKLGTVGSTAGRFVLDMSGEISPAPQFWGVATLETNLDALEPFGVFAFAKGTLQINTTAYDNCLLYTSPSPRDAHESRMPSSA